MYRKLTIKPSYVIHLQELSSHEQSFPNMFPQFPLQSSGL